MAPKAGMVYLVGAGPGDPGLITLKGKQCIEVADVIIYDYLASPELLRYARAEARFHYVGKKGGDHTLSQVGINRLIVEEARTGKTVARLKGGDPFVFGRGGEEAEELIAAGIAFEIVPGVTSAIAAPAYAGIPLTHRRFTSTVAFVTGHEDPTKSESSIDWQALADGVGTLVFFMGVKNLPQIVRRLLDCGKPADTPVALVRWGTTTRQVTVSGTLSTIIDKVAQRGLKAPAIIVIGKVVSLREHMAWFERRPLFGKRIVVTRARHQSSGFVQHLTALGAQCLEFPTIAIAPIEDLTPLDRALDGIDTYQWIVFTSVNGVDHFMARLFANGMDVRVLGGLQTAAIGPETARKLKSFGLVTDILPASYRAEAVVEAFRSLDMRNQRVLLPRAAEARPILPRELTRMGAKVDEIAVYQTQMVTKNQERLIQLLEAGRVDMVTFTSSSTVRNFLALLPRNRAQDLLEPVEIASIGPITTATAQEHGITVDISAEQYTIDGLCEAIVSHYEEQ